MKTFLLLSMFLSLMACTSDPLMVRYYLLHTPDKIEGASIQTAKSIVVLEKIAVANYLRQTSLVMQVAEHELYYSRQDVWAESLQTSFYNALLQDLNNSNSHTYVSYNSPIADMSTLTIKVKLEHFHATDKSTIVTTGSYWLSPQNGGASEGESAELLQDTFYFDIALHQDGYAHAVEQLRLSINQLAQQLQIQIKAMSN
jgi:uncharacterized lipoprotein YmbA